jgi:predicted nuclease with TOPRIM domain
MANSDDEEVFLFEKSPLYKELENKFDSLLYDSNFLTKQCFTLQKELSEVKKEKELFQTMNDELKKNFQNLQDSYFNTCEKLKESEKKTNLSFGTL